MLDYSSNLISGIDLPIPECQITLHQPSILEISYLEKDIFFTGIQSLCVNKNLITQGETVLLNESNFQIFMKIMFEKETKDKKEAVMQIFNLIFPEYAVSFTPNSILLRKDGTTTLIDNTNFEVLQEIIKLVFCLNSNDSESFNPGNSKAQEIAQKLMRGRQRVAAQKNEGETNIFSQYVSTLAIGLKLSLKEVLSYTMYQLYDQMERFRLQMAWDIDIKTRLAGGKPDSTPDNWMKNIH